MNGDARTWRRAGAALVVLLFAVGAGVFVVLEHHGTPERAAWKLVWADEFQGSTVDPANWVVEHESTYGDGGGQIACLMNRPENVTVADGVLRLTARREGDPLPCGSGTDDRFPQGRAYSSAHLSTKGLHEWTYARFEMRAELPVRKGISKGMWPAFWARPTAGGTGEIDVLEAVGSGSGDQEFDKAYQTIWYDYVGTHEKQANAYSFPAGEGPGEGMHTYAVDWSPTSIVWSIDGQQVYERTGETTGWLGSAFSKPFYLRLNLAVGGSWPGDPTADTEFPSSYDIDYVRVYQRS
ncbi:glycoside hydrolase family 16 protein [Kineosporia sp. J2-2]|uniref:Glycoside hydrolase family 16 protein n=1 Tax=Kineosporia corallincola TaxID=2835133 RepID=A0ABS5TKF3_9ACTN|nr:glycoside hydrolase family 16 protein [Kineosporia corallincola]MBT0770548.1 glycoside hydrolase family 16 protein [Kineosporia corallincola]